MVAVPEAETGPALADAGRRRDRQPAAGLLDDPLRRRAARAVAGCARDAGPVDHHVRRAPSRTAAEARGCEGSVALQRQPVDRVAVRCRATARPVTLGRVDVRAAAAVEVRARGVGQRQVAHAAVGLAPSVAGSASRGRLGIAAAPSVGSLAVLAFVPPVRAIPHRCCRGRACHCRSGTAGRWRSQYASSTGGRCFAQISACPRRTPLHGAAASPSRRRRAISGAARRSICQPGTPARFCCSRVTSPGITVLGRVRTPSGKRSPMAARSRRLSSSHGTGGMARTNSSRRRSKNGKRIESGRPL